MELIQIQQLIQKDFNLQVKEDVPDLDKLKMWLADEIQLVMDNDFQQFLNILYRIDISESKAQEAFTHDNPPLRLAELIIERELLKVASRQKYK